MLLDEWLAAQDHLLVGEVVDIGGKRTQKRGNYRPPEAGAKKWTYVNIDAGTSPDLLADAAAIPLPSETVDAIICTETLEHVPHPVEVVAEMWRLLKPGGVVVGSVPFLYPIHADPYDFQRFTPEGLRRLFGRFERVDIVAMGGAWGTMGMLMELALSKESSGWRWGRAIARRLGALAAKIAYWLDRSQRYSDNASARTFSTGYGFIVRKGSSDPMCDLNP